ncbi:hypothetical protein SDC9_181308 [bioreactor metagenome]|uniref:Uncharacterized protein n=1 Tax=bioreactor metagenome TaxID=1076179 RepID=A0A645H5Q1_9ZZZZ
MPDVLQPEDAVPEGTFCFIMADGMAEFLNDCQVMGEMRSGAKSQVLSLGGFIGYFAGIGHAGDPGEADGGIAVSRIMVKSDPVIDHILVVISREQARHPAVGIDFKDLLPGFVVSGQFRLSQDGLGDDVFHRAVEPDVLLPGLIPHSPEIAVEQGARNPESLVGG